MNRTNILPVKFDNALSKFIRKEKGKRSELASEAALHFPPPVFVLIDIAFRLSTLLFFFHLLLLLLFLFLSILFLFTRRRGKQELTWKSTSPLINDLFQDDFGQSCWSSVDDLAWIMQLSALCYPSSSFSFFFIFFFHYIFSIFLLIISCIYSFLRTFNLMCCRWGWTWRAGNEPAKLKLVYSEGFDPASGGLVDCYTVIDAQRSIRQLHL